MDKIISSTLKVIFVFVLVWVAYVLRSIFAYFLMAFIIASSLRPPIDFLEKKKVPRTISAILIFILFLLFVALVVTLIIPPLINEVQNFINMSPDLSQNFATSIRKIEIFSKINLLESIRSSFVGIVQELAKSLTNTLGILYKFFGGLFNAFFIIIISFYFASEKKVSEKISKLIAPDNEKLKKKIFDSWNRAEKIAGRWLYSYFILGTIVGGLVYIGLSLIGVKYALILAFLAGLLEIIPLIGPIFSGIVGSVLALLQGGIIFSLWTAFVFIIVQQLENFLIVPIVMKKRIHLHPILVIVVIFVAGKVFGPFGAILSIPITAIIIALVRENYSDYFIESKVKPLFLKRN